MCEEIAMKGREEMTRGTFTSDAGEAYMYLANEYYTCSRYGEAKMMGRKAALFPATTQAANEFLESLLEPGDPNFDVKALQRTLGVPIDTDASDMDLNVTETPVPEANEVQISDDEENFPSN